MLKKVYIRLDNVGCFYSYFLVFGIIGINRESFIFVLRVDFVDF